MKMLALIFRISILICFVVLACNSPVTQNAEKILVDSNNSINLKTQIAEIEWVNERQGFYTDVRDTKKYKVVKIGTQTWFAENLAFKPDSGHFWAYDDNIKNIDKYGYLYFWETAKNACPSGWHLPSLE